MFMFVCLLVGIVFASLAAEQYRRMHMGMRVPEGGLHCRAFLSSNSRRAPPK